ncbi:MAG: hypothetical protein DRN15_02570 [Thermoprotei archaeon]|nr:MAG: hypothetical protein DRM97_07680 [Thermoprotei archaeon]RLF24556.1 MAG: hypothetical protein DRN15_02570 [Thermoprotei archaeon]
MREKFRAGTTYRVEGPACVRVIEGEIESLGKVLRPREQLVVPKSKAMSFTVLKDSLLEVRLGDGARMEEIKEPPIPPDWRAAIERILAMPKPVKVLVLGDVDSGKSTFCICLANASIGKGFKTVIIDKDLGQSDIGAPTTIGMGLVTSAVTSLSQVSPIDGYFVGLTSPSRVTHRVIAGVQLLMEKALNMGTEVIIVNTSGWIAGKEARELKWSLISVLKPNAIVAIQRSTEIEHLVRPFKSIRGIEIIRVPSPPIVRMRNRGERRMLRESSYKRYLEGAKIRTFSLSQVGLLYTIYGTGMSLSRDVLRELSETIGVRILYGEEATDAVLLVAERPIRLSEEDMKTIRGKFGGKDVVLTYKGGEEGLLVGLLDTDGRLLGIGIVKEIEFERGIIRILTNVEGDVSMIAFGQIKLDENGRELRKFDGWVL